MSAFSSHHYGIQERSQPTQPPSPPMDDSNSLKLPPIRSFFAVAGEGSSPTSEAAPPRSPADSIFRHTDNASQKAQSRPGSGHANAAPSSLSRGLPPTPPMSVDAFFETRMNSPSARSASQVSVASGPAGSRHETTPPMDDPLRRPYHRAPQPQAYIPGQAPVYHHPPPPPPAPAQQLYNHMPYQRPLPQTFPPAPPQHYASSHNPHGAWQPTAHHHYLNPSQGPTYPQTQDRYICGQCSKAFSRPSSLRIHSHSHTGEKPFKCPHTGCGKAFSVRSNMKRHERGCHSFELNGGR